GLGDFLEPGVCLVNRFVEHFQAGRAHIRTSRVRLRKRWPSPPRGDPCIWLSAVTPPPLLGCEPHGFGAVATAPIHPALYQALSSLRARHGEDAREVPLDFRSSRIGNNWPLG